MSTEVLKASKRPNDLDGPLVLVSCEHGPDGVEELCLLDGGNAEVLMLLAAVEEDEHPDVRRAVWGVREVNAATLF